MTLQQLVKWPF